MENLPDSLPELLGPYGALAALAAWVRSLRTDVDQLNRRNQQLSSFCIQIVEKSSDALVLREQMLSSELSAHAKQLLSALESKSHSR